MKEREHQQECRDEITQEIEHKAVAHENSHRVNKREFWQFEQRTILTVAAIGGAFGKGLREGHDHTDHHEGDARSKGNEPRPGLIEGTETDPPAEETDPTPNNDPDDSFCTSDLFHKEGTQKRLTISKPFQKSLGRNVARNLFALFDESLLFEKGHDVFLELGKSSFIGGGILMVDLHGPPGLCPGIPS